MAVLLMMITVGMTAQNDSLKGKIFDNSNEAIVGVNILIKEASKGKNI